MELRPQIVPANQAFGGVLHHIDYSDSERLGRARILELGD